MADRKSQKSKAEREKMIREAEERDPDYEPVLLVNLTFC